MHLHRHNPAVGVYNPDDKLLSNKPKLTPVLKINSNERVIGDMLQKSVLEAKKRIPAPGHYATLSQFEARNRFAYKGVKDG
jgi:hypothetical protein